MGNSSVRVMRDFHNLTVKPKRLHLLDEPKGYISSLAKANVAHQMRFSVEKLEGELSADGTPHVLQLALEGDDERTSDAWTLYADGQVVAHGSGEFAHECFCKSATTFLDVCREAVRAANLATWSAREYQLLCAARRIAAV